MSEQTAGGQTTETTENQNSDATSTGENVDGASTIKPNDHKRTIDDMMKYKKGLKAALDELNNVKSELSKLKEGSLQSQNNYKQLWETTKQKLEEVESEKTNLLHSLEYTKKYDEVKTQAIKFGIRSEALDDLDRLELDALEVERTDKGRIVVQGADLFVENLKKTKPHWFETKKTPGFNSGGTQGAGSSGTVTAQDVIQAENKFKKSGKPEDKKAYNDIFQAYMKNRK